MLECGEDLRVVRDGGRLADAAYGAEAACKAEFAQ
jgi:hypothetical protein